MIIPKPIQMGTSKGNLYFTAHSQAYMGNLNCRRMAAHCASICMWLQFEGRVKLPAPQCVGQDENRDLQKEKSGVTKSQGQKRAGRPTPSGSVPIGRAIAKMGETAGKNGSGRILATSPEVLWHQYFEMAAQDHNAPEASARLRERLDKRPHAGWCLGRCTQRTLGLCAEPAEKGPPLGQAFFGNLVQCTLVMAPWQSCKNALLSWDLRANHAPVQVLHACSAEVRF